VRIEVSPRLRAEKAGIKEIEISVDKEDTGESKTPRPQGLPLELPNRS